MMQYNELICTKKRDLQQLALLLMQAEATPAVTQGSLQHHERPLASPSALGLGLELVAGNHHSHSVQAYYVTQVSTMSAGGRSRGGLTCAGTSRGLSPVLTQGTSTTLFQLHSNQLSLPFYEYLLGCTHRCTCCRQRSAQSPCTASCT